MRKLRNSELNRLSTEEFKQAEKLQIKVILDDVRSMHNVGSVFRTCDAFRLDEIVLGGFTPVPPHPEIEKTALGATQSMTWQHVQNLVPFVEKLKHEGWRILAIEQTTQSVMLQNLVLEADEKVVLVFGNEVTGVSQSIVALSDDVVEIPQFGTKHSLNVSVSAGIALWEVSKRFF